jgi:hypothetical protein
MRALLATTFDIMYLATIFTIGFLLVKRSRDNQQYRLFGIMAMMLALGQAFHLLPIAYALSTKTMEDMSVILGFGIMVSSIFTTICYVFLFHVGCIRYGKQKPGAIIFVYILAAIYIIGCQISPYRKNQMDTTLLKNVLRNIPYWMLIAYDLFFFAIHTKKGDYFSHMPWAVAGTLVWSILSVLFSAHRALLVTTMVLETLSFAWIVFIGSTSRAKDKYTAEKE